MFDGDLVLGPITGTYYSLFQKEISNIPTFTPSLFNQTRRITRHNVSVARYESVVKNGHDWSPASIYNVTFPNQHNRQNILFLPVRQNLFYFSGAGKFCLAHGLGQFICVVKSDVRTLNFRSDVIFEPL